MLLILKKSTYLLLCLVGFFLVTITSRAATFSPSLDQRMSKATGSVSDSLVAVVLFVDNSALSSRVSKAASEQGTDFQRRHSEVIRALQSRDASLIDNIKNRIRQIYASVKITEYWIAPALSFRIPLSQLIQLGSIPGVVAVIEDAPVEYIEPVESTPIVAKIQSVSSHLTALNIPALWSRGLKGRGRLVCSFDTGVEGTHPALKDKWRGNFSGRSTAWFAPSSTDTLPNDKIGHGTHTMGLMVGNAAADSFGVAPEADWISAAVIDQGQTLNRTISDILAAFQWAVDPDGNPATTNDVPDVILNSWGIPTSILPPCDESFYAVINNVEAAGIVTIFAAGNEGPAARSLRLPANRASSPLNAFAVGALDDATNLIAQFSSRGPSSCDTMEIKPEVVAPGVSIYSSYKGGTYRVMSGTSMAAPYIAGLVALLRQYNPNATVSEIKTAIINSARDLGAPGEDNSYGYGLPDAQRALLYMPIPITPQVYLAGKVISGDGIADPGETFDLFIRLNIPSGAVDSVSGYISCSIPGITVSADRALFIFEKGITYSMNVIPYVISFDRQLINGTAIPFSLHIQFPFSEAADTLSLDLTVGRAPNGNMITHITPRIQMTVSDFGQFGLGPNSVYNAGGSGFRLDSSDNLLYEAGIIIGRNALQLSSAIRDSLGRADRSDFSPLLALSTGMPVSEGEFSSHAEFVDTGSPIPIPITATQTISSYSIAGDDNYLIIRFFLKNNSIENLTGLYFGYLTDFDLNPFGDKAGFLANENLLFQEGGSWAIGVLPLTNCSGILTLLNGTKKITLTGQQKFDYIKTVGMNIDSVTIGDQMTLHNFGPFNIKPLDSVEISLALMAGSDVSSLQVAAQRARARYRNSTDVQNNEVSIPEGFELAQNYPNPFNPSTTIAFEIPRAAFVNLSVFNILGERVATLLDSRVTAGHHAISWDGTTDNGHSVSSGVYFYQLKSGPTVFSKKMLMMK